MRTPREYLSGSIEALQVAASSGVQFVRGHARELLVGAVLLGGGAEAAEAKNPARSRGSQRATASRTAESTQEAPSHQWDTLAENLKKKGYLVPEYNEQEEGKGLLAPNLLPANGYSPRKVALPHRILIQGSGSGKMLCPIPANIADQRCIGIYPEVYSGNRRLDEKHVSTKIISSQKSKESPYQNQFLEVSFENVSGDVSVLPIALLVLPEFPQASRKQMEDLIQHNSSPAQYMTMGNAITNALQVVYEPSVTGSGLPTQGQDGRYYGDCGPTAALVKELSGNLLEYAEGYSTNLADTQRNGGLHVMNLGRAGGKFFLSDSSTEDHVVRPQTGFIITTLGGHNVVPGWRPLNPRSGVNSGHWIPTKNGNNMQFQQIGLVTPESNSEVGARLRTEQQNLSPEEQSAVSFMIQQLTKRTQNPLALRP